MQENFTEKMNKISKNIPKIEANKENIHSYKDLNEIDFSFN